MGYFLINEDVVDRNDLNIEEKMACVVLARYADIKVLQALLSLDIISVKMGCSIERAQKAIDGLIRKGVLKSSESTASAIISKSQGAQMPAYVYQALEGESEGVKSLNPQTISSQVSASPTGENQPTVIKQASVKIDAESIQSLKDYFEEIVSETHVRMLLNLTKGHVDPVKKAYDKCRHYPSSKRIDHVVEILQSVGSPKEMGHKPKVTPEVDMFKGPSKGPGSQQNQAPPPEPKADVKKDEDYDALFQELGGSQEIKQLNQQINVKRIKQMYGTYGKKP